jgi:WD repeat-containing protein 23
VLVGHTEGITYVSPKGDGRYIISNGKDQALRLWDLRKMRGNSEFDVIKNTDYTSGFNYLYVLFNLMFLTGSNRSSDRYMAYPKPSYKAHPRDCSVMTYRGHAVLRTLIRCHFSPIETTGGQYLYSGSADGRIHVCVDVTADVFCHPG